MFSRKIDLTPPSRKQIYEFKQLAGLGDLFESVPDDAEEIDIESDQLDPDDQIDADNVSKRDAAEDKMRKVIDYDRKVAWDGKKPGNKIPAKKNKK